MKKSFMTRMLAVSLSAAMTFSLSSASSLTATEAAAKKLPANNKAVSISLKVGNSKVLKLKNYKAWNIKKGATNKKAVAAVANKGTAAKRTIKVTAKKKGTAKVTLTLGKRKTADSKTTKYSKTIKKVVTVKVKAADTDTNTTTPTDTTPTDTTTTPTTPSTTTDSAVNVTPGVLHISQAKATHADTIAVSFSSIVVSTSAVKVTVTRGDSTSPIEGTWTWGAGATGGEFKTIGKLSKGTYTVTATDGKDTTTATVEVADAEEVKEIVFKGDTALTGRGTDDVAGRYAYVYYDVLNQYGDSVKETYSIQWTSSANVKNIDRTTGRITLEKNKGESKEVFNYSDKIYVTGVYTKTGVTASGTFSVGSEQSVDKIKCVGFIKKGTQDILEKLPKDFKANEYQLIYNSFDQNGNQMEAGDYLYESTNSSSSSRSLTFVSTNVLVIKEILHNDGKTVTIKGNEYCAANIMPGINVNAGGTVGLSAIATKTGQKSEISVLVGDYRILKKFDIQAPSDYIIDGESVEIPFIAEDAEGNQIKLFKELATQSNFSRLTFNESVGNLYLEEMDDGNARLVWSDAGTAEGAWNNSSTNDIERPVSLTAIVVGGETDNELIQVSDKARPDGIADVNIGGVKVDDKDEVISYGDFTFVDQYGRNMRTTYEKYRNNDLPINFVPVKDVDGEYLYDNGFFRAAAQTDINFTGTDFMNYDFGINVALNGWDGAVTPIAADDAANKIVGFTYAPTNKEYISYTMSGSAFTYDKKLKYVAKEPSTGKVPEVTLKCTIQKKKNTNDKEVEDVSKRYTESFKVVSLEKLSNFRIKSMHKFNIETDLTPYDNGQKLADATGNNSLDMYISKGKYAESELNQGHTTATGSEGTSVQVLNKADNNVEIQGTYAGVDVDVPASHIAVATTGALTTNTDNASIGNVTISQVAANVLKYSDLYDTSTARYTPKDATDTIEAYVYKAGISDANKDTIDQETKKTYGEEGKITTVKLQATISDSPKALTTFEAADAFTMKPAFTEIQLSELMFGRSKNSLAFASKDHKILIKDQYNHEWYKVDAWNTADVPVGMAEYWNWTDLDADGVRDAGEVVSGYNTDFEFEYVVKDPVENPEGFVNGNFKVHNNASADAYIEGAERGDTFTVDITAKAKDVGTAAEFGNGTVGIDVDGDVLKTVKVTVGADSMCFIHDSDNFYSDTDNDLDENGQLKPESRKSVRDYLQYQLNEVLGTEGYKK